MRSGWDAVATRIARSVAFAMAVFHLWVGFFGVPDALVLRPAHLGFALVLAFLGLSDKPTGASGWRRAADLLFAFVAIAGSAYPLLSRDYIYNRFIYVDPLRPADWLAGIALVAVLLEATRRAVGPALPLTALAFLAYALLVARADPAVLLEQLYLSTEGIYGIPVSVSATYVVLFVLFGALVERTGTGRLFTDLALAVAGHSAGGPAKVACITSALFGTVSGSAVANVMTTGTFTIPLMRRLGYRAGFAGAVEAVASTGGQLMPPVMGAAAFIMAEFLGVSYLRVTIWALLPALLYYLALFATIHFESRRAGLSGLAREQLPSAVQALRDWGHLALPLAVVVALLLGGFSAAFAALGGTAAVVPAALLRATSRSQVTLARMADALIAGARNTVSVALACGCAGIVIGVITLTGLGLTFTSLVVALARDSLLIALVLTMVAGIVLGMGMPTSPAYIMQVALLVPALVKLGVMPAAAHLFALYFAVLSAITPPVALAVYAANGLSGGKLWETGMLALKLGLAGFIVPFMFVFAPALLLEGSWKDILLSSTVAIAMVIVLAAALAGWAWGPLTLGQRLTLAIAAVVLTVPKPLAYLAGLALVLLAAVPDLRRRRAG